MDDISDNQQPLSKTRRKQQAKEVEGVAMRLAELDEPQLARIPLGEELADEVALARSTSGRSSAKRQIKHLASQLRSREEALPAIIAALAELDQVARSERRQFHQLESLRDRLCDASSFEDALTEVQQLFPLVDGNSIARLARSVQQHADKRAAREIFRRLRDALEQQETDG